MFNWLKSKKTKATDAKSATPSKSAQPVKSSRDEVVATAIKNMQETRDIIGEEKLLKLAQLILQKKEQVDDVSPAVQAKKIIAQMDKDKLSGFMKLMIQDDQTKH